MEAIKGEQSETAGREGIKEVVSDALHEMAAVKIHNFHKHEFCL